MYLIFKIFEKTLETIKIKIKILYWKAKYGKKLKFRKGFIIEIGKNGSLIIGNNNFFNNYCSINCLEKIEIGNDNLFGENVRIYDHNHIFNNKTIDKNHAFKTNSVKIGSNNWFATNTCILSKSEIGDNNVFSANMVINYKLDNDTLVKNIEKCDLSKINYIGE